MVLYNSRSLVSLIRANRAFPFCTSKVLGSLHRLQCTSSDDTMSVDRNGIDVGAMRKSYKAGHQAFVEDDLSSRDPMTQFTTWFKEACKATENSKTEANAMTIATATKDGRPSARMVLLKGYDETGFRFFTNYESRKGKELAENPFAALVFYWDFQSRSIRIEGPVVKLTPEESTEYFHSRPKASQIGAVVSNQSRPIEDRNILTNKDAELKEQYKEESAVIPRPDYWGGFKVIPEMIEFWQGQSNRLHDRIVFRKPRNGEIIDGKLVHQGENGWVYERLSP
ncbi:pyridoxine-5'-phosphate oxidase-like [Lytechinus variegatus]|uniref:pyridoxine-5'-phosphate oxidase-like n=1 Tax=Lytechinus variegatus TaxID=7654 RepID=UPI001BB16C10|nr:pyridoxine-5'-phosphate oxidase-like [Lytechinus variegatus]